VFTNLRGDPLTRRPPGRRRLVRKLYSDRDHDLALERVQSAYSRTGTVHQLRAVAGTADIGYTPGYTAGRIAHGSAELHLSPRCF
jgi:hypothetical protein